MNRPALITALLYGLLAGGVIGSEWRSTNAGWVNLRGFGSTIVTAPSQALLGPAFRRLGWRRPFASEPRLGDLLQLALHVLVTAGMLYGATVLGTSLLRKG